MLLILGYQYHALSTYSDYQTWRYLLALACKTIESEHQWSLKMQSLNPWDFLILRLLLCLIIDAQMLKQKLDMVLTRSIQFHHDMSPAERNKLSVMQFILAGHAQKRVNFINDNRIQLVQNEAACRFGAFHYIRTIQNDFRITKRNDAKTSNDKEQATINDTQNTRHTVSVSGTCAD